MSPVPEHPPATGAPFAPGLFRPGSIPATERFNTFSHLLGGVLALLGTAVLVVPAWRQGLGWRAAAFAVYGTSLLLVFASSTLYHSTQAPGQRRVLRMLDHQAIYLLIAGTYTPFTLLALDGATGYWIFGTIWGLALLGITLDLLWPSQHRIPQIVLYLAMGWLCLLVLEPIVAALPFAGFAWLLAGGIVYTVGVVFYGLSHRIAWMHCIWHVLVLCGAASHYIAIRLLDGHVAQT